MEQIIKRFNDANAKYLVIGGQAIRLMGFPRYSIDWDFYIPGKNLENITLINKLLSDLLDMDMDLEPLGDKGQNFIQTFQTIYGILQFHLAPIGIPSFQEAEKNAEIYIDGNGIEIKTLSKKDLYDCKKKMHRPKDEDDILFLETILNTNTK